MTICFFIASLQNSGGTERATVGVAGKLAEHGYDVNIICWSGGTTSFFPLNNKVKCYSLYDRSKINIYNKYLPSFFKYRALLKRLKPDVIVDVCVPLSLLTIPATAYSKIKTISWEQFNVKVKWNNILTARFSRLLATKFASKIVVLTLSDKEEYKKRFKAKNTFIIPNPVTIAVKETSPLTSKVVLAVGRLTYQKGFDLLLQAWQKLKNSHYPEVKDWQLQIAGGGEDEQQLKQLADTLQVSSSVTFIPPTNQIERLFHGASIFVMSSRFEGLPLALVEAKAYGLPTVCFDCETGPREVITHEEDGLLVEAGNTYALSQSLIRVMINQGERRLFGAKSIEKSKRFFLDEVVKDWNKLFQSLA